ncbi:MAG: response regulator [Bacteroidetes bacterium]|nr:response regulator [Bacteroidota bacterium]MBU2586401.1 response regulator [Bacteroidota bacterium]
MTSQEKNILLIDDDPTIRKLIGYNLKKIGYGVFEADGPAQAFLHLKDTTPDLVLCDIMMSGMDGFEFCEKVRAEEKYKALPFIFVSAKSSIEDKSRAVALGADDFISKPFVLEELLLKIKSTVKRSEIYKSYGAKKVFEADTKPFNSKILIVDDDQALTRLLEKSLLKHDYEVKIAHNVFDGFTTAKEFQPDLILSDILMPDADGFEFKNLLSADKELKSIPFVFLTSKTEEADILRGYDVGVQDYVLKTSGISIIMAKVSAIIQSVQRERKKVVDELHHAADSIKMKVVPEVPPKFNGYSVDQWHSAYQGIPGGDFIDYIKLNSDTYAIVFGDVMGKKWGAWYFAFAYAGYIRSAIRFVAHSGGTDFSPAKIMERVNRAVYDDAKVSEIFATLSLMVLNSTTNEMKYTGAGDLPVLMKKAKTNEIVKIESEGLLLGFIEESDYQDVNIKLELNDELLLFTDGVVEAKNDNGEQFGHDRIYEVYSNSKSDAFLNDLKERLLTFTNFKLDDDTSAIWIKRTN